MCSVCGCGGTEAKIVDAGAGHDHAGEHGHGHHHHHHHHHRQHSHAGKHTHAAASTGESGAGMRLLAVERDLLDRNDAIAEGNRRTFADDGVFALNLVSSPGSGKTTLLARTAAALRSRFPVAVVEGDQQTSHDAERIRAAGVPAVQINTGKGCHLDAHMVAHALDALGLPRGGVLFIENVGNLVCPAAFDLGEAHKVVIVSVTEGEDKPLKYPDMFAAADLMLVNKIDLLPYVAFDVGRCVEYARRVNPGMRVIEVSATSGEGLEAWYAWVASGREAARTSEAGTSAMAAVELGRV